MTPEREMEARLEAWLEEVAAPRVPEYFEGMIAGVVRGRQRRDWWPDVPALRWQPQLVALLLLLGFLVAVMWAAAIGNRLQERTDVPPAVDALLSRPWQPTPLAPSPELAARVDTECVPKIARGMRRMPRVLLDVRGGYQAHAVYADADGFSRCDVYVREDGAFDALYTLPAEEPTPTLNPMLGVEAPPRYGEMSGGGSELAWGEYAAGRIAPGVSAVRILLVDGREVTASVAGGHYFGWWLSDPPPPTGGAMPLTLEEVVGLDADGRAVTGENGWFLPEFRPSP